MLLVLLFLCIYLSSSVFGGQSCVHDFCCGFFYGTDNCMVKSFTNLSKALSDLPLYFIFMCKKRLFYNVYFFDHLFLRYIYDWITYFFKGQRGKDWWSVRYTSLKKICQKVTLLGLDDNLWAGYKSLLNFKVIYLRF